MIKGSRIIFPVDVLKFILKHWYRVLIITIVVTIGFTAYSFVNDRRKTNAQKEADLSVYRYDIDGFSPDELALSENAVDAYEILMETQDYYDNSYIQKTDPFAVNQTVLYYKVEIESAKLPESLKGQEKDLANALRQEYYYYVYRGNLATDAAEKLGLEAEYVGELITVENDDKTAMNVIVRGTDLIPEFAETLKKCMDEYHEGLNKERNAHKLKLNDEYVSVVRVEDFYTRQKNKVSELNTCNNNLNNALSKLNPAQVAYYNNITGSSYEYVDPDSDEVIEPYVSIGIKGLAKKAVLGIIMGVLLSCILELLLFMYSKKIVCENDFTHSLGLVLFGNDKDEENSKLTVSKIGNTCVRSDIKKVVIAGSSEELLKKDIVEKIKNELTQKNTEVSVISNFVTDSAKVDEVIKTANLILVEGVEKSSFDEVSEEVGFCRYFGINLLGVISCTAK